MVLLLWLLVATRHPWHSWRVWLPLVFAAAGVFVFFWRGSTFSDQHPNTVKDYDLYHSLWHAFTAVAALLIVVTPTDFNTLWSESLVDVWKKVYSRNQSTADTVDAPAPPLRDWGLEGGLDPRRPQ